MIEKIALQIDNEIPFFAELSNHRNPKIIVICQSGNVYWFDFLTSQRELLGTLDFPLEYSKDLFAHSELMGFKKDFLQIHSFNNFICVVQKYGQIGVVFNLQDKNFKKILKRDKYYVEFCHFPIAFYEKDKKTFLIHGTDWNRLDITSLETDELLTERTVDYETNSNYFDYFHSSLLISPDAKHFTSNGWHWHPYGQIYCFSIEKFLQKFELSKLNVDVADEDFFDLDWDRPLAWIDKKTLAIGFNQQICDELQRKYPTEILLFDIHKNTIIKRLNFDGFYLDNVGNIVGELFYDATNKIFIGLNNKTGLLISDVEGNQIYRDATFVSFKYSTHHRLFYQFNSLQQTFEFIKLKLFIK